MQNQKTRWRCRWSPTLGNLESDALSVWGTPEYTPSLDIENPTVFFGVYSLNDFYAVWRHKGERHILWAGSDIRRLEPGYWLDEKGDIRVDSKALCEWLNTYCTNWCENEVEAKKLADCGIFAKVQPSFLGDVDDFPLSFKEGNKVYASVSGDDFELYGWDKINELAKANPELEFHLYGNTVAWTPEATNITVHGRVTKERMNAEIQNMQCGLRMTEFDGFSEILCKSVLWGQWPVSLIEYPHILKPEELQGIIHRTKPNIGGRKYYLRNLNNFPWVIGKTIFKAELT